MTTLFGLTENLGLRAHGSDCHIKYGTHKSAVLDIRECWDDLIARGADEICLGELIEAAQETPAEAERTG